MSRWGRGRGGSVALPLDSLFRENTNCPSAARSAGTVGKWGITSFTSIRSNPYEFSNNFIKSPVQDQNSPLTVAALEPELPPPKPKKFFKSRNAPDPNASPPASVAPPPAAGLSPQHSFSRKEEKSYKQHTYTKKSKAKSTSESEQEHTPEKLEIPKLKIHVEKNSKNKQKFVTKAAKKEEPPAEKTHLSPNKRYLVRNRDKVINYAEDRSNSPPPPAAATMLHVAAVAPPAPVAPAASIMPSPTRVLTPKTSPTYVKPGIMSPTNKDGKPPIVLRISKGTSRLISTDSEDVGMSPNTERNATLDVIHDPSVATVMPPLISPKHESLKITIKCFNKEGSHKRKGEKIFKSESSDRPQKEAGAVSSSQRASRATKRNHEESDSDDDNVPLSRRASSPLPGTHNYELYRTLASPARHPLPTDDFECEKSPQEDDIEAKLMRLDAGEPSIPDEPTVCERVTEPVPEPKPPESTRGRAMRNRAAVNYNESDSVIDHVTSVRTVKQVKSYSRKGKKKAEAVVVTTEASTAAESAIIVPESPMDNNNLLEILSEESAPVNSECDPIKLKINTKNSQVIVQSIEEEESKEDEAMEVSEEHQFKSPALAEEVEHDEDGKPSVKLVITKKKGSIFKSRSLVNDNAVARKKRHLYQHKWADDGKGGVTPMREPDPAPSPFDAGPEDDSPPRTPDGDLERVTRYHPLPVAQGVPGLEDDEPQAYTSVRCPKGAKEYYTVVRNVKKAHQIQEIGEFQEFNDDVEYILDALQDNNPMSTRCLSAITLASKCTAPAFRMHVRAHGTVQKFFRALHDATNDQSLGLCTATVMFVLSQDRLNMDLDRESLELMLNLLESDVSHKNALDDCGLTSAQLAKNKERVRELCAEIKSQGKAKHLHLDNITVGGLAMETLLSLTSKRAGEWFKEELRVLGGIEHIVRTVRDCRACIGDAPSWGPAQLHALRKADRCLRVLENVTQQNEENQLYLLSSPSSAMVDTLASLLALCRCQAQQCQDAGDSAAAAALREALLPVIKVMVNLSSPIGTQNPGADLLGAEAGVLEHSLLLLLQAEHFIPEENNFEFSIWVLILLCNLVQDNPRNIERLLETRVCISDCDALVDVRKPALQALVDFFYRREELARLAEQKTDAILDGEKEKEDETTEKKKQSHDEFIEETVTKLLVKAGAHMEHTMVASYCVLALGQVALASAECAARLRSLCAAPPRRAPMRQVLQKYYSFLNLTANSEAGSVAHVKTTQKIIDFLEKSDKEDEAAEQNHQTTPHIHHTSQLPTPLTHTPTHTHDLDDSFASNSSASDRMSSSTDLDNSFH